MKFPVWQTSLDVFKFMWWQRRIALRFAGVPIGVYLLAIISVQGLFGAQTIVPGTEPETAFTAPLLILAIVQLVLFLPAVVTWYRFVVLGLEEAQRRPLFTLGRLEWRYLLWQIIVIVIVLGFLALSGLATYVLVSFTNAYPFLIVVATIAGIASLVGTFLLMTRLSMILVMVSLDKPVSFKASWHMTKGVTWRLLGATLLVMIGVVILALPLGVLMGVIMAIVSTIGAEAASTFLDVATQSVVSFAGILGIATLFGFVYAKLKDEAAIDRIAAEVVP
ncbi:MAG: hypothetical protein K2P94_13980 [Rhodospirillaceae bacterium]|nr:hypothetical protein [Rhodospirillaceae bacterium]